VLDILQFSQVVDYLAKSGQESELLCSPGLYPIRVDTWVDTDEAGRRGCAEMGGVPKPADERRAAAEGAGAVTVFTLLGVRAARRSIEAA
jgi:hypothetical protein